MPNQRGEARKNRAEGDVRIFRINIQKGRTTLEEILNEETLSETEVILAEVDRRIQDAVTRALTDAREQDAKMGAMTDEERASYELSRREEALNERERILAERELRALALSELTARSLPADLAEALPCDSETHLRAALDIFERVFRTAVQAQVEERLKGGTPSGHASAADGETMSDEDYYKLNMHY